MARTKLEISKADFQKVVTDLEAAEQFVNPSALWKAVEDSDWAKGLLPRPMKAAVAYMRAKELGIIYKTQPGKRGNGGLGTGPRGPRTPRSQKMKKYGKSFAIMKQEIPERFAPVIARFEKGSSKAAIKLKCLECSGYQPVEIKLCTCVGCPLYPIRPFQGKKVEATEPV